MNVVSIIMKVAPIGLSAFFASTMASQDTDLISSFASTITLFLVTSTLYFFLGATFYAYLAGGKSTLTLPAPIGARVLDRSRTFLFHSSLPGEQLGYRIKVPVVRTLYGDEPTQAL